MDQHLTCSDCGDEFIFGEEEQAFFLERGFKNTPKRCPGCRRQRRSTSGPKLLCAACGKEFTFSESEQQYFKEMGLANAPRRCRTCRSRRRESGEKAAFDEAIKIRDLEKVWE